MLVVYGQSMFHIAYSYTISFNQYSTSNTHRLLVSNNIAHQWWGILIDASSVQVFDVEYCLMLVVYGYLM